MRPFLVVLLLLPLLAGCTAPARPGAPACVADATRAADLPGPLGEAPWDLRFRGRPGCVLFTDARGEGNLTGLLFRHLVSHGGPVPDAQPRAVLLRVEGAFTGPAGERALQGEDVETTAPFVLEGPARFQANASLWHVAATGEVAVLDAGRADLALDASGPLVAEGFVLGGETGRLVVHRLAGATWRDGALSLRSDGFSVFEARGLHTRGAAEGWTAAGAPVSGDLTVLGRAWGAVADGFVDARVEATLVCGPDGHRAHPTPPGTGCSPP